MPFIFDCSDYFVYLLTVGIPCDFESGLCGWTQDTTDDFDWTSHSGTTDVVGTGPSNDHTLGTSAGKHCFPS